MIEFCLVGGGFIGPVHAANIAANPQTNLRWVVDIDGAAGPVSVTRRSCSSSAPIRATSR